MIQTDALAPLDDDDPGAFMGLQIDARGWGMQDAASRSFLAFHKTLVAVPSKLRKGRGVRGRFSRNFKADDYNGNNNER
jgi:hypothetical protein